MVPSRSRNILRHVPLPRCACDIPVANLDVASSRIHYKLSSSSVKNGVMKDLEILMVIEEMWRVFVVGKRRSEIGPLSSGIPCESMMRFLAASFPVWEVVSDQAWSWMI